MKKQYWNGDRLEAMKYLRQCGLNDPQIGEFFGVSRQRVGQLVGVATDKDGYTERRRRRQQRLVEATQQGYTQGDIQRIIGGGNNMSGEIIDAGIRYADYSAARIERRKQFVIKDITAMMNAGYELTTTNLQRYSRNLHDRAMSVMGIKEWKKYFGVE